MRDIVCQPGAVVTVVTAVVVTNDVWLSVLLTDVTGDVNDVIDELPPLVVMLSPTMIDVWFSTSGCGVVANDLETDVDSELAVEFDGNVAVVSVLFCELVTVGSGVTEAWTEVAVSLGTSVPLAVIYTNTHIL